MNANECCCYFDYCVVAGVLIEPYTRHMHMSLAYRFADEHQAVIEDLASKIDASAKCKWELRVYSRDRRVASHEVCIYLLQSCLFLPLYYMNIIANLSGLGRMPKLICQIIKHLSSDSKHI